MAPSRHGSSDERVVRDEPGRPTSWPHLARSIHRNLAEEALVASHALHTTRRQHLDDALLAPRGCLPG
eukprot:5110249-Pyramimonas_sp.AAC.1